MSKRKICVVTGTRADYGLLYWLMKEIQQDEELLLQLVATGMHLSPEFGLTYRVIEEDGFTINAKVEMLLSSDTPVGIAKSIGLGTIGMAEALDRLKPDLLVLLGDRYEILAAAQAAMVARIPIAHIAGGDTTEGAIDESIRHSITKMSHLHFVTNDKAAKRITQLGENPEYIFNVGNPGLDQISRLKLLERNQLEEVLEFKFSGKNLLVTFHPATLDSEPPACQFQELLTAIDNLPDAVSIIITKPNSDTYGRKLIQMIDEFSLNRPSVKAFTSLGQLLYLSVLSQVDVVVGNSSSGLYEAPSFKKPTVNIGNRQKGRLQATSIINCQPKAKDILESIHKALTLDCSQTINPYGDGNSTLKIVQRIKGIHNLGSLLYKHFHEVRS